MKHYYYLHTNGDLIHKNASVVNSDGASSYFDSDFVKNWWCLDDESRLDAWNLCIFALEAGANRKRIDELIEKWGINNEDGENYCSHVGLTLKMDGNAYCVHKKDGFTNTQECPAGFGDTAFDAICNFYSQLDGTGKPRNPELISE